KVKTVELKRVGVLSAFKFFAGAFMIVGLVLGFFVGLAGIPDSLALSILPLIQGAPFVISFTGSVRLGVMAAISFAIFYGIAGGLIYTVFALLYNIFAIIFGGVRIKVDEKA
ncbi:unnamed protein product, partial [marine sediment metagenome]